MKKAIATLFILTAAPLLGRDLCFRPTCWKTSKLGQSIKYGYAEFVADGAPYPEKPKIYRRMQTTVLASSQVTEGPNGEASSGIACLTWLAGPYSRNTTYISSYAETLEVDEYGGSLVVCTHSGNASGSANITDNRLYTSHCEGQDFSYQMTFQQYTDSGESEIVENGCEYSVIGSGTTSFTRTVINSNDPNNPNGTFTSTGTYYPLPMTSAPGHSSRAVLSPTSQLRTWLSSEGSGSGSETVTLSKLFTTHRLIDIGKERSAMTPAELENAVWNRTGSAVTHLTEGDTKARERILYFYFEFPAEAGISYTVSWTELTVSPQSGVSRVRRQWNSPTLANAGILKSPTFNIQPPYFNAAVYVVDEIACPLGQKQPECRTFKSNSSTFSGCCGDSSGLESVGSTGFGDGILYTVDLGMTAFNIPAGSILLQTSLPDDMTATPAGLRLINKANDTEVILDSEGQLAQVRSRSLLAHVEKVASHMTRLHLFPGNFISQNKGANGLYPTNGVQEIVVWQAESPNAQNLDYSVLKIGESRSFGVQTLTLYEYNSAGTSLTITAEEGYKIRKYSQLDGARYIFTEDVLNPTSGIEIERHSQVYTLGAGFESQLTSPMLVERRSGIGADERIEYIGWDLNTGILLSEQDSTGGWRKYETQEFSGPGGYILRRATRDYSAIGNHSYNDFFLDNTKCRRADYDYSALPDQNDDNATLLPTLPRTETSYVLGKVVAKMGRIVKTSSAGNLEWIKEISLPSEAANWSDPAARITLTRYYTTGSWAGRVHSVLAADGTLTTYSFSETSTQRTVTFKHGQPNSQNDDVVAGTRTVTVSGLDGRTLSTVTYDIASDLVTDSVTYSNPDPMGRFQTRTYLGGLAEHQNFDCCGMSSSTAKDGTVTSYTYDALKRLETTTLANIVTKNIYGPSGRLWRIERIGTDGSVMLQSEYQYDTAGRIISESNPLGIVTFTKEDVSNGWLQRTIIHAYGRPDQLTRNERYYRDGYLAETGQTFSYTSGNPIQTVTYTDNGSIPTRYGTGVWNDGLSGDVEGRLYQIEIKLATPASVSASATNEWIMTSEDFFGRPTKRIFSDATPNSLSDNPRETTEYLGMQTQRDIDADGIATIFWRQDQANSYVATDLKNDNVKEIDLAGSFRVTKIVTDVVQEAGYNNSINRRRSTYEYKANNATPTLVKSTSESVDGMRSWTVRIGAANPSSSIAAYSGNGAKTVTTTEPDGSYSISQYLNGRLQSMRIYSSSGTQVSGRTYLYDPHGREWKVTDSRSGTVVYSYDNADRVVSVQSPDPGNGTAAISKSIVFDDLGREIKESYNDGSVIQTEYYPGGQVKRKYGAGNYPVAYVYDAQGRMTRMATWSQRGAGWSTLTLDDTSLVNSGASLTKWNYNQYRGWLDSKRFHDDRGPDYSYTKAGRIKTRDWGRMNSSNARIRTTWVYGFERINGPEDDTNVGGPNDSGDVIEINYSNDPQNTPSISFRYDRCGHQTTVQKVGGMKTTRSFDTAGNPRIETYEGGTLGGFNSEIVYDNNLRRQAVIGRDGTTVLTSAYYDYDNASRLSVVRDGPAGAAGTASATYFYLANSGLPGTITYRQGSNVRMTTTRSFDRLGRLYAVTSQPSGAGQASLGYVYGYDDSGRRTAQQLPDGSEWTYQYDRYGQVIDARRSWVDGTPVAGQQYSYNFDEIGNRVGASLLGGDASGSNHRSTVYSLKANRLNQYDTRTVPGYVDILGVAHAQVTPTINSSSADARKGEYYWKQLSVDNSAGPVSLEVTVNVPGGSAQTGRVMVAPSSQSFTYDDDGNLTSDGLWNYIWDAENRLIEMTSVSGLTPTTQRKRLTFEYDDRGRRIAKKVYHSSGAGFSTDPSVYLRFLYEGWNLLAEIDSQGHTVRSYLWGNDMSGSPQGAGGIAGLVRANEFTWPAGTSVGRFPAYDGNGNVVAFVNAADGITASVYEYGPFGEAVRESGSASKQNPIRFSTKYRDAETELCYFGYRWYQPSIGRWLSRDPSEEDSGPSLYAMVGNGPVYAVDYLGMWKIVTPDIHERMSEAAFNSLGCLSECNMRAGGRLAYLRGLKKGVVWGDAPEGVDVMLKILGQYEISPGRAQELYGDTLTFRTHVGDRQFLHAMSSSEESVGNLVFYMLISSDVQARASKSSFENGDYEGAGFEAGKLLHMVQDSYSRSHVIRTRKTGTILQFQDFTKQSTLKHGGADKEVGSPEYGLAIADSILVLEKILCDASSTSMTDLWWLLDQKILNGWPRAKLGGTDPDYEKK